MTQCFVYALPLMWLFAACGTRDQGNEGTEQPADDAPIVSEDAPADAPPVESKVPVTLRLSVTPTKGPAKSYSASGSGECFLGGTGDTRVSDGGAMLAAPVDGSVLRLHREVYNSGSGATSDLKAHLFEPDGNQRVVLGAPGATQRGEGRATVVREGGGVRFELDLRADDGSGVKGSVACERLSPRAQ